MNYKLHIMLGLLTFPIVIFICFTPAYPTSGTTISVNPDKSYVPLGQTLTVNIAVSNVTNLNAWQLRIAFNPSIINCINITIPVDNIFGSSFILFPPQINNTLGYVLVLCILDGTYGVNGSGVLVQAKFSSLMPGISSLEIIEPECPSRLCDTYLQKPDYDLIPFEATDGTAIVTKQGFNENLFTVTIGIKTYYVLIFSNSTITAFNYDQTWKKIIFDATGPNGIDGSTTVVTPKFLLDGNITMVLADNTPIPYSFSNNATHTFIQFTYQHSTRNIKIFVTVLGDVNGDRKVRVDDVLAVALAFGSSKGDPDWNPYTDLNGDGKVRVDDVLIVAIEFGTSWEP